MMLSTIFLTLLGNILLNPLTTVAGVFEIKTKSQFDDVTTTESESTVPSSSIAINDVTVLETKLNVIVKSMELINNSIRILDEKTEDFIKKQKITSTLNEEFQKFNRKLDKLQRAQDDQETYGNKLTALEFTLNHVLSKVVYLSDNCQQPRAAAVVHHDSVVNPSPTRKTDLEILTRLTDLLRHVQNIERDHCRRKTIPAAAGPIGISGLGKIEKIINANENSGNHSAEEIADHFRKLEQRLNSLITISSGLDDLKKLLFNTKNDRENLENILITVKRSDKLLEQWTNDDSQQRQRWQPILQYCQGVSDELSTFAGSSDVSLKRLEALVRDVQEKINYISTKRKGVDTKCIQGNFNGSKSEQATQGISIKNKKQTKSNENQDEAVHREENKNDCHELTEEDNHKDGIYKFATSDLNEAGRDFNLRYCAFATDERAWTVIQRRGPFDIQENFNRSWVDYRNGFGQLNKDFWFGNEFIHRLTYYSNYELLIEMENFDGGKMSVSYGTFGLDRESYNYNLFIGDYKGPGGDSLSYHNFMDFSTYDRLNGKNVDTCCACAIGYGSGWWFDNCLEANLNGVYHNKPLDHDYVGIIWNHWLGDYSLKAARMLIRPKNWTSNSDVTRSIQQNHEDP